MSHAAGPSQELIDRARMGDAAARGRSSRVTSQWSKPKIAAV